MKLTDYPNELPAITLDFQNSRQLDPRINFSRASAASPDSSAMVNGKVQQFGIDVPRLSDNGLLIEATSTNFFAQGQKLIGSLGFALAYTNGITESASATAELCPDGVTPAYRYELSNVDERHYMASAKGTKGTTGSATEPKVGTNIPINWSIYIKPDGWSKFVLVINQSSGNNCGTRVAFDLSANPAAVEDYGFHSDDATGSKARLPSDFVIEPLANGWFRIGWAMTTSAGYSTFCGLVPYDTLPTNFGNKVAALNPACIYPYNDMGFDPGAAGLGFYACWGQVENQAFVSSYIPTTGTVATRAADICAITEYSWHNPTQATWVTTAGTDVDPGFDWSRIIYMVTSNAGLWIDARGYQSYKAFNYAEGVTSDYAKPGTKGAFAYAEKNIRAAQDGVFAPLDTTTTGVDQGTVTSLHLGSSGVNKFLNGYIERISFYPTRVPDAALEALTT